MGCEDKKIVITTEFEENELMRIEETSCFVPELMLYLTNLQNRYEQEFGSEIWNKSIDGVRLSDNIKNMVLAQIAQVKVMNLMATDYGISLTEEEKALISESTSQYYASLNADEITLLGATPEVVEKIYTEYAIANKVYEYIIRDINPEISDDEARTIEVMHILIKTYALDSSGNKVEYTKRAKNEALENIEAIRARATDPEEPEDFEALALEYNEDDVMTYSFGRGEMAESFEEAAFSLDTGEISPVIETEYGYHIIKCISTFDIEQTQENKKKILLERKEKVFEETYLSYIQGLRKNLNEDLWDSFSLIKSDKVVTFDMFSDKYTEGFYSGL